MLRERNTFVLKAICGNEERRHAITLHVNLRKQDLAHFNGTHDDTTSQDKLVQRLLDMLDGDESFQTLIHEMNDLRQLEQLVRAKAKERVHTLQCPDVTVQWQVADEPGLSSVLLRAPNDDSRTSDSSVKSNTKLAGKYRPLPVRKLVVSVWIYPPHVEIPLTEDRIPTASDVTYPNFFVANVNNVEESDELS